MKKAYNDIIERIINSLEHDTHQSWCMPWESDKSKYSDTAKLDAQAEQVLNTYYAHERITFIEKEQDKSYYSPSADMILLPLKKQFKSTSAYYATKCHETIHSTGEYTRCNRPTFSEYTTFRFGDVRYSKEEIIAELGACFLLSELGIDTSFAEHNTVAYLRSWLTKLNKNPNWIFRMSEPAADAVEYIFEIANKR